MEWIGAYFRALWMCDEPLEWYSVKLLEYRLAECLELRLPIGSEISHAHRKFVDFDIVSAISVFDFPSANRARVPYFPAKNGPSQIFVATADRYKKVIKIIGCFRVTAWASSIIASLDPLALFGDNVVHGWD